MNITKLTFEINNKLKYILYIIRITLCAASNTKLLNLHILSWIKRIVSVRREIKPRNGPKKSKLDKMSVPRCLNKQIGDFEIIEERERERDCGDANLDGGITTAVEDLPCLDGLDRSHRCRKRD